MFSPLRSHAWFVWLTSMKTVRWHLYLAISDIISTRVVLNNGLSSMQVVPCVKAQLLSKRSKESHRCTSASSTFTRSAAVSTVSPVVSAVSLNSMHLTGVQKASQRVTRADLALRRAPLTIMWAANFTIRLLSITIVVGDPHREGQLGIMLDEGIRIS